MLQSSEKTLFYGDYLLVTDKNVLFNSKQIIFIDGWIHVYRYGSCTAKQKSTTVEVTLLNFNRLQVYRNPNIGVYVYTNNKVALIPPGLSRGARRVIEETLMVECIETTIAGSRINGVFIAGNDDTVFLPSIATEEEVEGIRSSLGGTVRIVVLETRNTALGNLIVANNKGILVSPVLEDEAVEKIRRETGLPIYKKNFLGIPTTGSMMVVNDKTGLAHPLIPDPDLKETERILGVRVGPATVNEGVGFVKTGILLNNNGVLVGQLTTGPEIMNIHALLE